MKPLRCEFCGAAGARFDPAIGFLCCSDTRACSRRQRDNDGTSGRRSPLRGVSSSEDRR